MITVLSTELDRYVHELRPVTPSVTTAPGDLYEADLDSIEQILAMG